MTPAAATRLHHPFSPSKLQYLEACTRFDNAQSADTTKSEAGTRQHDAAEDPVDIDDPRLEDHEALAVAACKKYRDEIIALVTRGTGGPDGTPIILKEEYVHVDNELASDAAGNLFKGTTGGYLDLAIISADKKFAHILDWKFGLWSVEPAENNLQGIAYLLGIYRLFPTLEKVTVHFVMPHRNEIDTHTFHREEFLGLLLRVKVIVARASDARLAKDWNEATMTTGTCLFCANIGRCPKVAEFAVRLGKKYNPLAIPAEVNPSLMFDAAGATQAMEVAQVMEGWAKGTRQRITAKAIEEDVWMPQKYVLRARQDTVVVDQDKFVEAAKAFGVSDSVIAGAKKYKVEPIYKAIRDQAPRGEKEKAEEVFREENLKAGITDKEQPIYFLERIKS